MGLQKRSTTSRERTPHGVSRSREYEGALNQLRRSEAYLAEAQQLSHTGSFGWDVSSGEIYWSAETFRIFAVDPTETATIDLVLQRTHPEDRKSVQELVERVTQQRIAFDFEHRLLLPDGSVKYVHTVGRPSEDETGHLEFVGAVTDVSEGKLAEHVLRRSDGYLKETQRLNRMGSWAFALPSRKPHYWSEELFRIWGFDPKQGTPDDQTMLQRVHPDDREKVRQYLELLLVGGVTSDVEGEHRIVLPDGTVKYVHGVVHPVFDDAGHVVEYVGSLVDVTDRKRDEEALRRSEAYLAEAQRLNHSGSWAQRPFTRKAHYWSEEMAQIWGFPQAGPPDREEVMRRIHPDDRERAGQFFDLMLKGLITADAVGEFRILSPNGTVKYVHGVAHPVFDEAGQVAEYIGTDVDVTERKRADEALRRSEAYLAEAQKLSHTGSWAIRPGASKSHYWSEEMFRIYGCDPRNENPDWRVSLERIHPDDRETVWQDLEVVVEGRLTHDDEREYRILMPDGTARYIHAFVHPVFDEAGQVVEYIGTDVDVTERKRADEALRRSEAYLAEAQKLSHTGSWALDPATGKMIYYSEEMFRIMELNPTLGPPNRQAISQRIHPEDLAAVVERIERIVAASKKRWIVTDPTTGSSEASALMNELQAGRDVEQYEVRVVLPDGSLKYLRSYGHAIVDKTGRFVEWVGTTIDVTEQKKSEFERERLRQLEADLAHVNRISMLGELAAAISHELRQPITAGIMSAKTAVRWLGKDQPNNVENACQSATDAVKAGERAVEIIERLRSLYTKTPPRCELLDGNKIIGELVEMLRVEANRYKVLMNADLAAPLPMIMSDRVQLQQVLMNLILNAIEAMKETGGSISIESRLNQQGFLQISVSDTGPGLPVGKLEKIFEPFFSTKPKGSGMGLAISRSIVESYGGRLWAAPNSARGACFNFTLPIAGYPSLSSPMTDSD